MAQESASTAHQASIASLESTSTATMPPPTGSNRAKRSSESCETRHARGFTKHEPLQRCDGLQCGGIDRRAPRAGVHLRPLVVQSGCECFHSGLVDVATAVVSSAHERDARNGLLVVGAGAAGMAFTDALLAHSDRPSPSSIGATRPEGHWLDAYPFVQAPSTVRLLRRRLGAARSGHNRHDRQQRRLLRACWSRRVARVLRTGHAPPVHPPGRSPVLPELRLRRRAPLRFPADRRGHCDVRVRQKLVDTTCTSRARSQRRARHPSRWPTACAASRPARSPASKSRTSDFAIIGGGRQDRARRRVCGFSERGRLGQGDSLGQAARHARWMNRRFLQPHTLLPDLLQGTAMQLEAMAQAGSIDELFDRLESEGVFLRIDPKVSPTMFRGAIMSESELHLLRRIEDVVHMGHVRKASSAASIVLAKAARGNRQSGRSMSTCTARRASSARPLRPIFEPGRVDDPALFYGLSPATTSRCSASSRPQSQSDEEKNGLCSLRSRTGTRARTISTERSSRRWSSPTRSPPNPKTRRAGTKRSRLNPVSGAASHRDDPRVVASRERIKRFGLAAAMNLQNVLSGRRS